MTQYYLPPDRGGMHSRTSLTRRGYLYVYITTDGIDRVWLQLDGGVFVYVQVRAR